MKASANNLKDDFSTIRWEMDFDDSSMTVQVEKVHLVDFGGALRWSKGGLAKNVVLGQIDLVSHTSTSFVYSMIDFAKNDIANVEVARMHLLEQRARMINDMNKLIQKALMAEIVVEGRK